LGKGTKGGGLGDPQFIGASRVGYTPAVCSEELGVALVVVGNVPSVPGFKEAGQPARTEGKCTTAEIVGLSRGRLKLYVTIHVTKGRAFGLSDLNFIGRTTLQVSFGTE